MSLRILVAGQPKTGNVWLRKIFSELYALQDLNELLEETPKTGPAFAELVERGNFPDDAILQEHLWPRAEVLTVCEQIGCHPMSVLRSPYDAFVSLYHFANNAPQLFRTVPAGILIGKPLNHPDVVHFISTKYRRHLRLANSWLQCDRALIVRYEDLTVDALAAVANLVEKLLPRSESEIVEALAKCTPERMRSKGGWMKTHVRSAKGGDGKSQLSEQHLAAFRDSHQDLISSLGYAVL